MTKRVEANATVVGTPAQVWPLVTDPRHVRAWYAFGGAEIDLRPGGAMRMRWDEHGEFEAVVEAVVPDRLFAFRWAPAPGPLVEITLEPEGRHATRVRIVESGDLEAPEQSELAWRNGLDGLGRLAADVRGRHRMRTQYYTATSLDGFIATEDDSLDWLFPLGDLNASTYPAFIADVGALAMGSTTYEWILEHADRVEADTGSPWPYPQPTWVFTRRRLPPKVGADVRFVAGDVRPVHAAMRAAAGDKNAWIVGGGDLAGQFFDAGLLDDLIVQVGSVTLGRGKPLFPRQVLHPTLRLVSVHQMGSGMAELRYEVEHPTVR